MKQSKNIFFSSFLGTITAILVLNFLMLIENELIFYLLLGVIVFAVLIRVIKQDTKEGSAK